MRKQDEEKREKLREILSQPEWQAKSINEVNKLTGFSRALIGRVKREMAADGTHPPLGEFKPGKGGYIPDAVARGGYVYGPDGRPRRDTRQP